MFGSNLMTYRVVIFITHTMKQTNQINLSESDNSKSKDSDFSKWRAMLSVKIYFLQLETQV